MGNVALGKGLCEAFLRWTEG